ncbi:SRPBCC family protein [Streptomyces sp. NPDC002265]|uniref:SRPBCC family protein n=1 Tax=Streptomyces sp. NPDC002265 TaxID=3154415 RepID=UPI00331B9C9B
MPVDLTGTCLTLEDGRTAVRFERTYDHPVERVWRFVTDADELVHWFPSRAEIELRPGGTVAFSGDPHMPPSTGRVVHVDPPRALCFDWGGDELCFDLAEARDGRTRLVFTDVLGQADAAARNGAGWEVCLAALDALARGERPAGPHSGTGVHWKEYYDAYVAAGVPSGAPIPDLDT